VVPVLRHSEIIMAFTVRVHAYQGLKQIFQSHGVQFSSDSVKMLMEPYIWGQAIVTNGATAVSLVPNSTTGVKVIRIEVPSAQFIRYEINPVPGSASERVANANSPILSGIDIFDFHPGWGLSLIEGP
jgi:hypothetical protein